MSALQPRPHAPQTLLYGCEAKGWYDGHGQRHDSTNMLLLLLLLLMLMLLLLLLLLLILLPCC